MGSLSVCETLSQTNHASHTPFFKIRPLKHIKKAQSIVWEHTKPHISIGFKRRKIKRLGQRLWFGNGLREALLGREKPPPNLTVEMSTDVGLDNGQRRRERLVCGLR